MISVFAFPVGAGLFGLGAPELLILSVFFALFVALPIAIAALAFVFKRRPRDHDTRFQPPHSS